MTFLRIASCALLLLCAACAGSSGIAPSDAPSGGSSGQASSSGGGSSSGAVATDGGASSSSGGDTGAPSPAAGCTVPPAAAGLAKKTIDVAGTQRRYQVFVPTGYDGKRPLRLVFVFHGLGGDGDQIRSYFSFESEAAGEAIFVYPEGVAQSSVGGATGWGFDCCRSHRNAEIRT